VSARRALKRDVGLCIALTGILLAPGCSEKVSVGENKERTNSSRQSVVRIVFQLPGDDIGGQEYQPILDAIRAEIIGTRAGEIISSGYGMGTMEIVVAVDSDASTEALKRIVGDIHPEANYRIEHKKYEMPSKR
jgi:hypothetical protein